MERRATQRRPVTDEERVPVVVAAGHAIERDEVVSTEDLVERAARAALDEAPKIIDHIDRISVVSTIFSPSVANGATDVARRLGISPATVKRHWTIARAWLLREIEGAGRP